MGVMIKWTYYYDNYIVQKKRKGLWYLQNFLLDHGTFKFIVKLKLSLDYFSNLN